jgi:ribose 5-phosphate isomerase B
MKVAIGSDHAGFRLKDRLKNVLLEQGHEVEDVGVYSDDRADYPDLAHQVAERVEQGGCQRGVLVCGSGIGVCITANRHVRVRAVNCTMEFQAEMSRRHNDANVLCLGERVVGSGLAWEIASTWLAAEAEGGERHARRRAKIEC